MRLSVEKSNTTYEQQSKRRRIERENKEEEEREENLKRHRAQVQNLVKKFKQITMLCPIFERGFTGSVTSTSWSQANTNDCVWCVSFPRCSAQTLPISGLS